MGITKMDTYLVIQKPLVFISLLGVFLIEHNKIKHPCCWLKNNCNKWVEARGTEISLCF